jgi:hypothetical protein
MGCYRCVISPKRSVARKLGLALLRLRNDVPGVSTIRFEGVPRGKTHDAFVAFINGENAWPAHIPFDRSQYKLEQVAAILREYFPRNIVEDVNIDDQSIFGGRKKG